MTHDESPDYGTMRIGKLRQLAASGDAGAQETLGKFLSDVTPSIQKAEFTTTESFARLNDSFRADAEALDAFWEEKQRKEREAVEREEAVLRELAEMRQAALRADRREEVAVERARAAEARELRSAEGAEHRESLMVRMTIASVALTAVSAVAAVVAIFVTG